jgi:hypothetical protein
LTVTRIGSRRTIQRRVRRNRAVCAGRAGSAGSVGAVQRVVAGGTLHLALRRIAALKPGVAGDAARAVRGAAGAHCTRRAGSVAIAREEPFATGLRRVGSRALVTCRTLLAGGGVSRAVLARGALAAPPVAQICEGAVATQGGVGGNIVTGVAGRAGRTSGGPLDIRVRSGCA